MGNIQSLTAHGPVDDAFQYKFLGACWLVAFYGVAMILTTMGLLDRWMAPRKYNGVGVFDWVSAIVLSTAWPIVLTILVLMASKED